MNSISVLPKSKTRAVKSSADVKLPFLTGKGQKQEDEQELIMIRKRQSKGPSEEETSKGDGRVA